MLFSIVSAPTRSVAPTAWSKKAASSFRSRMIRTKLNAPSAASAALDWVRIPVHVLNELVRQVPEGIYITAVKQDGQTLNVAGIAQTQERVSELLRNTAYNSEWLVKPELIESKAATLQGEKKNDQKRLFDFSVRLTIKRPQDAPAAASQAVAAGPIPAAASAPASSTVVAKKT